MSVFERSEGREAENGQSGHLRDALNRAFDKTLQEDLPEEFELMAVRLSAAVAESRRR